MIALNRVVVFGCMLLALTGCQQSQPLQQSWQQALPIADSQRTVLSCMGTPSCQFERINQWYARDLARYVVQSKAQMTPLAHWLVQAHLKTVELHNTAVPQTLSLPAAQYEVVIQFYPISKARAETFHLIHRFDAQQAYRFKMFRKRDESEGSLLNVSTPDPLCVDLYQGSRVIRRFCRPFDALTGTGEFTEQKL